MTILEFKCIDNLKIGFPLNAQVCNNRLISLALVQRTNPSEECAFKLSHNAAWSFNCGVHVSEGGFSSTSGCSLGLAMIGLENTILYPLTETQ